MPFYYLILYIPRTQIILNKFTFACVSIYLLLRDYLPATYMLPTYCLPTTYILPTAYLLPTYYLHATHLLPTCYPLTTYMLPTYLPTTYMLPTYLLDCSVNIFKASTLAAAFRNVEAEMQKSTKVTLSNLSKMFSPGNPKVDHFILKQKNIWQHKMGQLLMATLH